jgi:EAL domain-containing protein (putative c-di-GMP-specific phosphodiesterase class I)/CheY-like chemotaxis protein
MEHRLSRQPGMLVNFDDRRMTPCVYVVDRKQHIRTFLCEILEELGWSTDQCGQLTELVKMVNSQRPDLIVLGLSAGGEEIADILKRLAGQKFAGKILLFGPPATPMLAAVQEFGEKLGLAMLTALATPFGSDNLRESVATLLAIKETPQFASVNIEQAIAAGWLDLWYQPKIDVRRVAVSGAAAFLRMRHPTWGILTPSHFMPHDGDPQLSALSEFVIERGIRDWHDFVGHHGPIEIGINLPIAFFHQPDAIRRLCGKMPNHPASQRLMIEINATEVIRSLPLAHVIATQVRFHNIGISIRNLGTEWSSLTGMPHFPFVEIKVDRKFVSDCSNDQSKKTVCRRIVELADAYGVRAVAEGVETMGDFLTVRDIGFDLAQGFLFAKPMAAMRFARTPLSYQLPA